MEETFIYLLIAYFTGVALLENCFARRFSGWVLEKIAGDLGYVRNVRTRVSYSDMSVQARNELRHTISLAITIVDAAYFAESMNRGINDKAILDVYEG